MQSEGVLHRDAEAAQKRASESAEALLGRNRFVSMVQEVRYLPFQSLVMRKIGHVTDVMVGTDKNEMIGCARNCRTAATSAPLASWRVRSESK